MNEALINSVIDKVDAHEKKISELSEKTAQLPDYTERLNAINTGVTTLRNELQKMNFPQKEMHQLSNKLEAGIEIFKQPIKQEIKHHHHAPKVLWATGILFLIVCLVSIGWYQTTNRLDLYKASDTKYRYLKLKANKGLGKWLRFLDRQEREDPKLRDKVIATEEENQRKLETLQRAIDMEKEAKELKQQVTKADTSKEKKVTGKPLKDEKHLQRRKYKMTLNKK